MNSALNADLIVALIDKSQTDILKEMGYEKPQSKNFDRLQGLLSSEFLGLDRGSFDFKYSTTEFLIELCKVARLDVDEGRQHIEAIKQYLSDREYALKPYLFIDTNFDRHDRYQGRTLAFASRRLKIPLQEDTWRLRPEEQLQAARNKVLEHMAETDGVVEFWGDVVSYRFFIVERRGYVLSPKGEVIGKHAIGQIFEAGILITGITLHNLPFKA